MSDVVADFPKCLVTAPDGIFENVRFVYKGGVAAVWLIDMNAFTARRILYASGVTFHQRVTARDSHHVLLPSGQEWLIRPSHGGCGCGPSPLKRIGWSQLLAPDFSSVP